MNGTPADSARAQTLRLELKRSAALGVLDAASGTFLLLVAVQHLQAGAAAKALLVAGVPLGLLLSPLATSLVRHRGWTAARGLSVFGWTAAAGFVLAAAGGPVEAAGGTAVAGASAGGATHAVLQACSRAAADLVANRAAFCRHGKHVGSGPL